MKPQLLGMLGIGIVLGAMGAYSLLPRNSSAPEAKPTPSANKKETRDENDQRLDLAEGQVRVEELGGMENYTVLFGYGSGMELNAYRYAGGLVDFTIELDGKVSVDPARAPLLQGANVTGLAGYFGWLRIPEGELQERWFFGNRTYVVPAKLAQVPAKLSVFTAPFPDQDPSHNQGGGFGESIRDLFANRIPEGGQQKTETLDADGTPFPFPKDKPVVLKAFDVRRLDAKGNIVEKHRIRLIAQVVSPEEQQRRLKGAEGEK